MLCCCLVVHRNCVSVELYVTTKCSLLFLFCSLFSLGMLMAGSLSPSATLSILSR